MHSWPRAGERRLADQMLPCFPGASLGDQTLPCLPQACERPSASCSLFWLLLGSLSVVRTCCCGPALKSGATQCTGRGLRREAGCSDEASGGASAALSALHAASESIWLARSCSDSTACCAALRAGCCSPADARRRPAGLCCLSGASCCWLLAADCSQRPSCCSGSLPASSSESAASSSGGSADGSS